MNNLTTGGLKKLFIWEHVGKSLFGETVFNLYTSETLQGSPAAADAALLKGHTSQKRLGTTGFILHNVLYFTSLANMFICEGTSKKEKETMFVW